MVELFAREGAQVLTCSRSERKDPLPQGISSLTADVSRSDDVKKLASEAVSRLGKIDILVNNAGVQVEKTVVDSTDEDFEALMSVNTWGVFALCREFIPLMAGNGGGTIINIGSISADHADPSMALYNASKAFVHSLTRSIAVDHGHQRLQLVVDDRHDGLRRVYRFASEIPRASAGPRRSSPSRRKASVCTSGCGRGARPCPRPSTRTPGSRSGIRQTFRALCP